MSISFGEKLKLIRGTTELSQPKFAELIGIPHGTYKKHENGSSDVSAATLESIATNSLFAKYSLWLLTGETNIVAGQVAPGDPSPEIIEQQIKQSTEEYEKEFKDQVEETIFMLCSMEWFKMAPDVKLTDCSTIMLNKLQPIIDQHSTCSHKKSSAKKTA